jgi:hypothetical protein
MSFYDFVRRATVSCATCSARSEQLLQCPCRTAFYCDSTCQVQHWPTHKHHCTHIRRNCQPKLHRCNNCGEASLQLHSCQCGAALYCNIACQREHWPVHRDGCGCWSFYFERVHSKYRDTATQTIDAEAEADSNDDPFFCGDATETDDNTRSSSLTGDGEHDLDEFRGNSLREGSMLRSVRMGESNVPLARSPAGGSAGLIRAESLLNRAASSIRRSVTEIFFTTAKVAQGDSREARRQQLAQQLIALATIEEDNRRRLVESCAAEEAVLALMWRALHSPRLLAACVEQEKGRRLRLLAEYNLWVKQMGRASKQLRPLLAD